MQHRLVHRHHRHHRQVDFQEVDLLALGRGVSLCSLLLFHYLGQEGALLDFPILGR